jgi:hypothetical protein
MSAAGRLYRLLSQPSVSTWGHRKGFTVFANGEEQTFSHRTVESLVLAGRVQITYGAPPDRFGRLELVQEN